MSDDADQSKTCRMSGCDGISSVEGLCRDHVFPCAVCGETCGGNEDAEAEFERIWGRTPHPELDDIVCHSCWTSMMGTMLTASDERYDAFRDAMAEDEREAMERIRRRKERG